MKIEDISDDDLRGFCKWFTSWHGSDPAAASVITTCMTGYFKTYSKAADKLLARCKQLKLVTVSDGVVTIAAASGGQDHNPGPGGAASTKAGGVFFGGGRCR